MEEKNIRRMEEKNIERMEEQWKGRLEGRGGRDYRRMKITGKNREED